MLRSEFFFDVLLPTILLCWAAVLGYSAFASDTGYGALAELQHDVEIKRQEVDALEARRRQLEKHADLLKSSSLDPDMIDERIREVLGYNRKGDIIVSRKDLEPLLSRDD